jgi:hypothetical protein
VSGADDSRHTDEKCECREQVGVDDCKCFSHTKLGNFSLARLRASLLAILGKQFGPGLCSLLKKLNGSAELALEVFGLRSKKSRVII